MKFLSLTNDYKYFIFLIIIESNYLSHFFNCKDIDVLTHQYLYDLDYLWMLGVVSPNHVIQEVNQNFQHLYVIGVGVLKPQNCLWFQSFFLVENLPLYFFYLLCLITFFLKKKGYFRIYCNLFYKNNFPSILLILLNRVMIHGIFYVPDFHTKIHIYRFCRDFFSYQLFASFYINYKLGLGLDLGLGSEFYILFIWGENLQSYYSQLIALYLKFSFFSIISLP